MRLTPRRVSFLVLVCVCAFVVPTVDVFAAGDTNETRCSNETLTGFSSSPADCRAYEMVTPPYKGGAQVIIKALSEDGSRVVGDNISDLAGTGNLEAVGLNLEDLGAPYEFERTGSGWNTIALDPPASVFPNASLIFGSLTSDLERSLWLLGLSAKPDEEGRELYIREADGTFKLIGPAHGPGMEKGTSEFYLRGASADLSHIVFDRPGFGFWPGDTTVRGNHSLYEYVGTGNSEPFLVGVRNSGPLDGSPVNEGAELISQCATYLGSTEALDAYNAVSESGDTIFFTARAAIYGATHDHCPGEVGAGPPVEELYARIGGEKTVAISEPSLLTPNRDCTGICATDENTEADRSDGVFQGASTNGSKVFFLTEQPLVNADKDTTMDLYGAEIANGAVSRLTMVSEGGESDPHRGDGAEVQGVARVSEDGKMVYFVAKGVLTEEPDPSLPVGHQTAIPGEDNLYVYEAVTHTLKFIATLSSEDEADWSQRDERPVQANACTSAEELAGSCEPGRFLVFPSRADLVDGDTSDVPQLFEYDARTGVLVRASVGQKAPADGGYECPTTKIVEERFNCDGNTTFAPDAARISVPEFEGASRPSSRNFHLEVSGDGSRVFFTSADALTPQALDNVVVGEAFGRPYYANNLYEFNAGNTYLISDGRDTQSVGEGSTTQLVGADPSGTNVFLETADGLVPQDTDTDTDLYDARIDGGFAPSIAGGECSWDACQGPLGPEPPLLGAGSASQPSGGNLTGSAGHKAAVKPKPLTRTQMLARALKACHAMRAGRRRASCEATAKKRYGAKIKLGARTSIKPAAARTPTHTARRSDQ
jgi:hypothetical protein